LIEVFKSCIGAQAPIGRNGSAYRVQVTDVRFHRWLESIGITPRKSLTLGALVVPSGLLVHAIRGLLDGDGSIYTGFTVPNRRRYPDHVYQRLNVRFHSASLKHIQWLRVVVEKERGLQGWVTVQRKKSLGDRHAPMHVLRYSKHESMRLLEWLYANPMSPRLDRKWRKWIAFREAGKPTRTWHRRGAAQPATIPGTPE